MSLLELETARQSAVVARRWIVLAAVLFVLGAIATVFSPNVMYHLTATSSGVSATVYNSIDVVLSLIQWGSFAAGAALLGAGLVILHLSQASRGDAQLLDGSAEIE